MYRFTYLHKGRRKQGKPCDRITACKVWAIFANVETTILKVEFQLSDTLFITLYTSPIFIKKASDYG